MSSSEEEVQTVPVKQIFQKNLTPSSSEEPPMTEWSSLMSIAASGNLKMDLYKQGLYDPGSGEICTKYISMSASSVLRHPYYAYPGIKDPGIKEALLESEERKIYALDGQELYLDLCEEMNVIPIRSFHRGLLEDSIDLKYYGVNPVGVRAMTMALNYNRYVRRLDLTSNFLTEDACYHLGQMLSENIALQEIILAGCRIQADGVRKLVVALSARSLEALDLSGNEIGDAGFEHLAFQLGRGAVIKRLNLSRNDLSSEAASSFALAIEGNKTVTHLDLSWNKMVSVKGVNELLSQLGDSSVLVELNMAWNSLKISRVLKKLLSVPTLRILDLSNNKLTKQAVTTIANNLQNAKSLHTLDLSFNPLTAEDAYLLVFKLRTKTIKLVNLFMDNVEVNKTFVKERKEVLKLSFRKKCKITHGNVKHDYTLSEPDMREILMKRIDYLTARSYKKNHLDIAIYFLKKKKTFDNLQPREILRDMKLAGTPVDEDLVNGLTDVFPGPKLDKGGKTMDLAGVVEMVQRMWPDKQAPPTPPEPEPEAASVNKGKKK